MLCWNYSSYNIFLVIQHLKSKSRTWIPAQLLTRHEQWVHAGRVCSVMCKLVLVSGHSSSSLTYTLQHYRHLSTGIDAHWRASTPIDQSGKLKKPDRHLWTSMSIPQKEEWPLISTNLLNFAQDYKLHKSSSRLTFLHVENQISDIWNVIVLIFYHMSKIQFP